MGRSSRNTQDSKSEILKSALEVIRRSGAPALTIDAVAEESGFSKGGVLYNFPTKDALITGMVEYLAKQFHGEVESARAEHLASKCPTLSAMIDVTEQWLRERQDVARAMLATKADKPDLSEPFKEVTTSLKKAVEAETDQRGKAWVIWSSLEGMHFSDAHCASVFTEEDLAAAFRELRRSVEEL